MGPYSSGARPSNLGPTRKPVKKVLVVDDSETIRLEVSRTLGQAGFSVLEARDGAEGLATAIKNPDLALLVTTEGENRLIERAKKAGAKGWFIKPVKPEMLLMATKKLAR